MTIYHNHHIIPRHAGGSDDLSNLVQLTIEEHAQAHLDLYEEFGRIQDLWAYKGLTGQMSKEEMRIEAVKIANTGRKQTPEHIQKRTASRMKTNPTPTLGKKLGPASEERKQKIGNALRGKSNCHLGRKRSEETKEKMRQAALNRTISRPCKKNL
jgi:hypothetical protein